MKGRIGQMDKDKENVSKSPRLSSGSSSMTTQKSLIPVLVSSSTPLKNENTSVHSPATKLKIRRPLGQLQCNDSPKPEKINGKSNSTDENEVMKISDGKMKLKNRGSLTQIQFSDAGNNTPCNSPVKLNATTLKSGNRNDGVRTSKQNEGSECIAYWKDLAESRRKALEDALLENYSLHQRVEELEGENSQLHELVEQAEKLAELISDISTEEDANLDESGIVDSINVAPAENN